MTEFLLTHPLAYLLAMLVTYFMLVFGTATLSFGISRHQPAWRNFAAITVTLVLLGFSALLLTTSHDVETAREASERITHPSMIK